MEHKIKVGITQGDINGVGYEVILKTLSDPHIVELCTPVVYGSAKVAAYHRKALDIPAVNFNIISDASAADENKVNLITCVDDDVKVEIGKATAIGGEAAYAALERAAADMEAGSIDVLLTAPINKHAIQSDKFDFPGHTEYLERRLGNGQKALMILLNDTLRVALVSGHVPVSKVSSVVTKETILEKLQIFEQSLRQDFCVVKPRIAVLALNPHAGDDGLLGTEEIEIIKPAIQEANAKGMLCFGPYPADGFFGTGHYRQFDGVLAMEYLSLHPAINSRWQQTKQDSYISPSFGNESYFFLFRNSLFNLFHSFINGSNPEQSFSFCHSGVYKSGTNIGKTDM